MKDLQQLLQMGQQLQSRVTEIQERLDAEEVSASAGGGMVKAIVDGKGTIKALSIDGTVVDLIAELTTGGRFNTSTPLAGQSQYGTISIDFISCNEAVLTYDFPAAILSGTININRVLGSNIALCGMLDAGIHQQQ